jgi:apolipoprotein N-acyltransferase
MLFNKLNNWLKKSFRLVLMVMVCGLLFISSAYPAHATPSKSTDGEANLNRIQAKTDKVARSNPQGLEEVTKEAQKGINEVQGAADKDKMISPEDASDATTVEEQAKGFLDKLAK